MDPAFLMPTRCHGQKIWISEFLVSEHKWKAHDLSQCLCPNQGLNDLPPPATTILTNQE